MYGRELSQNQFQNLLNFETSFVSLSENCQNFCKFKSLLVIYLILSLGLSILQISNKIIYIKIGLTLIGINFICEVPFYE